jgi:hypothetical protein
VGLTPNGSSSVSPGAASSASVGALLPTAAASAAAGADAGRHLGSEFRYRTRIVGGHDEGPDPVFERQPGELGGRLARGRADYPQVQQPPDRRGFAPGSGSRRVDHGVAGGEVAGLESGGGGPPPVGEPADQPQHPGLERAHPDADVVHRCRPAEGAGQPVVLALEGHAAMHTGVPEFADHVDAFLEGFHAVARIEAPAAHRLNRVPGDACADAELGASVAQDVEARDSLRQHRRWPERQAEHVGRQSHPTGPRGHEGHQGQGVQGPRGVGMVVVRDQVVPRVFGEHRQGHHLVRGPGGRLDEDAELEVVPVISHVTTSSSSHR